MHDLNLIFEELNRLYWKGNLPRFECEWSNRMITTWGCCYRTQGVIRISTLFQSRPLTELSALLCHEMIHIRIPGHGKRFKNELKRIGLEGDIERHFPHLTRLTDALRRSYKYIYQCVRCKIQIQRRKKIRGYCYKCYEKGVRARFRMMKRLHVQPLQLQLDY